MGSTVRQSVVMGGLLLVAACKPVSTTESSGEPISVTKPADPMAQFFASGRTEIRAKSNFYYAIFKSDYERRFDALPKSSEVSPDRVPYAGGWYPQSRGGTNVRMRGMSPLEKYDAVFNKASSYKAVEWERRNHTVGSNSDSASWAGHCNGYSAAASRHLEPSKQVIRGDVTFYPEDIKALLAEIYMGAKFYFLGGNRCAQVQNVPLTAPGSRQDPLTMGSCDDVNPGTFHVAVTNWIGVQKIPVIFDTSSKEQVWNYPHWKYKVDSRLVGRSEAMKLITGSNREDYKFNPEAKQFQSVGITVQHSNAIAEERLTAAIANNQRYISKSFTYVLELNDAGEIIGGEWVGQSQKDHPDFIWVALEPMPGDGSPYGANPYVDATEVLKLWAESAPPNSPKAIMEPKLAKEWGRFPRFDVEINGASTGVAFALEESIEVILKPREGLSGAQVEALLDGKPITFEQGAAPRAVISKISEGIHVLDIKWKSGSKLVDEQRARFHVIR